MVKKATKKSPARHVKLMLAGVFAGGNIASLLLLYACCFTSYVSPAVHPRISVMGIFFPFMLLANVAFVPFWLIFKKKFVLIPLLGMLLCSGFILDYFPVNIPTEEGLDDKTLKVITWNTHGYGGEVDTGWHEFSRYLEESGADLLCLQETQVELSRKQELLDWAKQSGFYHSETVPGREIYSRYPILSGEMIEMVSDRANGATHNRILVDGDTVHVIVVHLESNGFSPEEKGQYQEVVKSRESNTAEQVTQMVLSKLAVSARFRGPQIDSLTQYLARLQGQSVILCGDFNDTPVSYAYQQVNRHLRNAFRHSGNGLGVTYNQPFFWVRIDHLFYSSDWTSVSADVDETIDVSDHYPLLVTLKKREK